MTRLELPFPLPVSACFENVPKVGRRATARYREWTNEALWMIKSQKPQKFAGEVSISIGLVAPDKRARDCDNTLKGICDVLFKAASSRTTATNTFAASPSSGSRPARRAPCLSMTSKDLQHDRHT
jgi:hypothetical protein